MAEKLLSWNGFRTMLAELCENIRTLWQTEHDEFLAGIEQESTDQCAAITQGAIAQAAAIFVGTENNYNLLTRCGIAGKTYTLGTDIINGIQTDAVSVYHNGSFTEQPLTLVYNPNVMYLYGDPITTNWQAWLTTDGYTYESNTLTIAQVLEVEAGQWLCFGQPQDESSQVYVVASATTDESSTTIVLDREVSSQEDVYIYKEATA